MPRRNSARWRRTPPVVDIVFYTDAEPVVVAAARAGALEFLNAQADGDCGSRVDQMFPTPVSPTGNRPATGFVCAGEYTTPAAQAGRQFIARNNLPVELHQMNLSAFLSANNLLEITDG